MCLAMVGLKRETGCVTIPALETEARLVRATAQSSEIATNSGVHAVRLSYSDLCVVLRT